MKKTLLASAIAVSALGSINAQAGIAITNMLFGTTNYAASGSLNASGTGSLSSVDPFFYHTWTATQATGYMDTAGTFAGSNAQGAWDYSAEISDMSNGQFAIGMFFNWNGQNGIALLEIFECSTPERGGPCFGSGVVMDNGPFAGSVAVFSGAVPVPAAVWLMGSGLIGLVSITRRRQLR